MDLLSHSPFWSALLAQLPSLLLQLGFAVALLAMVLAHGARLGRARLPAIAGATILVALALLTRPVFAALQAWARDGGGTAPDLALLYTVAGTVFQVLGGIAIVLLGVAIVRR